MSDCRTSDGNFWLLVVLVVFLFAAETMILATGIKNFVKGNEVFDGIVPRLERIEKSIEKLEAQNKAVEKGVSDTNRVAHNWDAWMRKYLDNIAEAHQRAESERELHEASCGGE